jgi:hypothetical protein
MSPFTGVGSLPIPENTFSSGKMGGDNCPYPRYQPIWNTKSTLMNKRRWLLGGTEQFILFLLLITLGWVLLAQADYIENPIQSLRSIVEVYNALQAKPATIPPPSSEVPGFFTDFDWSAWPDLLYDVWFICLITATIIMLTHLFAWLSQRFKQ